MKLRFSAAAFSILFCCGYMLAFALGRPLFRFYPVRHEWSWGAADQVVRSGPPVVWYGLVASATAIGVLAAFAVRDRWISSVLRGWLWVWPWLGAAGCFFLLKSFFL